MLQSWDEAVQFSHHLGLDFLTILAILSSSSLSTWSLHSLLLVLTHLITSSISQYCFISWGFLCSRTEWPVIFRRILISDVRSRRFVAAVYSLVSPVYVRSGLTHVLYIFILLLVVLVPRDDIS